MSSQEGDRPLDATIADKLRDVVIAIHKSGKTDDLTVKRVRARAEKELGLDEGFLKTNLTWKQKSQDSIVEAVEKYCHEEPTPEPSPKKPAPKKPAAKPKAKPVEKKTKSAVESTRGVKRKAAVPAKKPKKRAKTESEESEAELSEPPAEIPDAESESPPKKTVRRGKRAVVEEDTDEEEAPKPASKPSAAVEDESEGEQVPTKQADTKGDLSDSELSSVIDEEPVRKKKAPAAKTKKEKAPAKPKAASKPKAEDDPDAAEVKRLQGWLVKCGVRKVWARDPELSKCDTSKEKIRVLKNMLKDVGMDGKYSTEKAAKIKEQREFAKDLEAIQEGELAWGKTNEVTATGRPSRRAAARPVPMQKVVLEDDSEEEEDGGGGDEKSDDDDDDEIKEDSDDDGDKSDDSKDDDS
ncbi:hypothetical protein BDW02DRAFT_567823, partial [Decorospora gaudefroyi]